MKTVEIVRDQSSNHLWKHYAFSLLEKIDNGRYKTLLPFSSCRSYMCDGLFMIKNPTYTTTPSFFKAFNFNPKKGHIYIGIDFKDDVQKNVFFRNLSFLYEREMKAKVRKSKVMATQEPLTVVVEGSGYWKDSCWKMMLYTFYLKTLAYKDPYTCDAHYWTHIRKNNNEEILLSKVKCKKEIFHPSVYGENNNRGRHDCEGFVSICCGKNKPMADYLGVIV